MFIWTFRMSEWTNKWKWYVYITKKVYNFFLSCFCILRWWTPPTPYKNKHYMPSERTLETHFSFLVKSFRLHYVLSSSFTNDTCRTTLHSKTVFILIQIQRYIWVTYFSIAQKQFLQSWYVYRCIKILTSNRKLL